MGQIRTEYYDFVSHGMVSWDQRQMERIHWRKIAYFLEAVGGERTIAGLGSRTLIEIVPLFHLDYAFFFVADARNIGQSIRYFGHHNAPELLLREYLEHYFLHDPVAQLIPTFKIGNANWMKYQENELTRDFLPRAGVSHSIGASDLVETGALGVVLVLNRGGTKGYTEADMLTMAALYPHIHNLSEAIISPHEGQIRRLEKSFATAGLSPREQEVALLLFERLSVGEIAERLFLSRKTVAKHLEHIYSKLGLHGKRNVLEVLLGEESSSHSAALSLSEVMAPYAS